MPEQIFQAHLPSPDCSVIPGSECQYCILFSTTPSVHMSRHTRPASDGRHHFLHLRTSDLLHPCILPLRQTEVSNPHCIRTARSPGPSHASDPAVPSRSGTFLPENRKTHRSCAASSSKAVQPQSFAFPEPRRSY